MILAVVLTAALFGALFVYGMPYVQNLAPLANLMQKKWAMILVTGAFLIVVVYVTSHVLKVAKIKQIV